MAILQAYVQYAGPFDLNEMTAQLILKEVPVFLQNKLNVDSNCNSQFCMCVNERLKIMGLKMMSFSLASASDRSYQIPV